MIKKVGILTILFIMVITIPAYGFSDVDEKDWYFSDIKYLKDNQVTLGYKDGSYKPKNPITNAETLTMLLRATNIPVDPVEGDHWALGTLMTSYKQGIIEDMATFSYDEKATRGSVARWAVKSLGLESTKIINIFKDTSNIDALTLYEEGIIKGEVKNGDRFYYPDKTITRAEIGVIVSRIMKYKDNKVEFKDQSYAQKPSLPPVNMVKLSLVAPLSETEYDISNKQFQTQEDFKKLFVYMGHNNLTTYKIRINGLAISDTQNNIFKEALRLGFKEAHGKYPEYYSTANSVSYQGYGNSNYVDLDISVNNINISDDNIKYYRAEFFNKIDHKLEEFITNGDLRSDMTQYDMAKFLFDWIVQNTEYDYSYGPLSYTGYGQIVHAKAVCQGYTASYNYMLKRLGIATYGISGFTTPKNKTEEAHLWTIAYLDGTRYHIDTTWGDSWGTRNGETNYKYFASDGASLSKTHSWDKAMYGQ